jgi:hypothetical protein
MRTQAICCGVAVVPKTIDNDVPLIEKSFGFDTAVEVTVALARTRDTPRGRFTHAHTAAPAHARAAAVRGAFHHERARGGAEHDERDRARETHGPAVRPRWRGAAVQVAAAAEYDKPRRAGRGSSR